MPRHTLPAAGIAALALVLLLGIGAYYLHVVIMVLLWGFISRCTIPLPLVMVGILR